MSPPSASGPAADRLDPKQSAKEAGLVYVTDETPGIRRKRWGRGFTYFDVDGERITDPERRAQYEEMAIPPAWTDVWISPSPRGHIQATGRDAKGRKQYIYHERWHEVRNETKFHRLLEMGRALPALRERLDRDCRRRGLDRAKVVATVISLLDETLIRVGNPEYARENESFGLTTLLCRHVEVNTRTVRFEFLGKGGKEQEVAIRDRRLARLVAVCHELPGHELFQYLDADDRRHPVDSDDVNRYLKEATGHDLTAKDFRTWGASAAAALALRDAGRPGSDKEADQTVREVIEQVAEELGNTPAVARQFYIDPRVVEAYRSEELMEISRQPRKGLEVGESILLRLLEAQVEV